MYKLMVICLNLTKLVGTFLNLSELVQNQTSEPKDMPNMVAWESPMPTVLAPFLLGVVEHVGSLDMMLIGTFECSLALF